MNDSFSHRIIIVDESSLIPSNKMKEMLTLSEKIKFKMVVRGDSKQLGSVEVGKLFHYMQEHRIRTAII